MVKKMKRLIAKTVDFIDYLSQNNRNYDKLAEQVITQIPYGAFFTSLDQSKRNIQDERIIMYITSYLKRKNITKESSKAEVISKLADINIKEFRNFVFNNFDDPVILNLMRSISQNNDTIREDTKLYNSLKDSVYKNNSLKLYTYKTFTTYISSSPEFCEKVGLNPEIADGNVSVLREEEAEESNRSNDNKQKETDNLKSKKTTTKLDDSKINLADFTDITELFSDKRIPPTFETEFINIVKYLFPQQAAFNKLIARADKLSDAEIIEKFKRIGIKRLSLVSVYMLCAKKFVTIFHKIKQATVQPLVQSTIEYIRNNRTILNWVIYFANSKRRNTQNISLSTTKELPTAEQLAQSTDSVNDEQNISLVNYVNKLRVMIVDGNLISLDPLKDSSYNARLERYKKEYPEAEITNYATGYKVGDNAIFINNTYGLDNATIVNICKHPAYKIDKVYMCDQPKNFTMHTTRIAKLIWKR